MHGVENDKRTAMFSLVTSIATLIVAVTLDAAW